MKTDVFGNLCEWDRVLEQLEKLHAERLLDEHQEGLARILRFRRNWRLEKRVLELAVEIEQANDILIAEVLAIVVDNDRDLDTRMLAVRAIGSLLNGRVAKQGALDLDIDRVHGTLVEFSRRKGPPVLVSAVSEQLNLLKAPLSR